MLAANSRTRVPGRGRALCLASIASEATDFRAEAEDVHPRTSALWGNSPQTYSMAGLVLTAFKLSRRWEDRYWRGSS
jgi:hypothetical protein